MTAVEGMAKVQVNAVCSIARSLEVLGERWTFLILREAFSGVTRFTDFRAAPGIAPDVLSDRLSTTTCRTRPARPSSAAAGEPDARCAWTSSTTTAARSVTRSSSSSVPRRIQAASVRRTPRPGAPAG
jgi:hypothetical protein